MKGWTLGVNFFPNDFRNYASFDQICGGNTYEGRVSRGSGTRPNLKGAELSVPKVLGNPTV